MKTFKVTKAKTQTFKPTNIKNSQYVVSLHTDSKSGIPHLHIVANRIDNMGKTNDAHYIGERAVHAASKSVKTASQY